MSSRGLRPALPHDKIAKEGLCYEMSVSGADAVSKAGNYLSGEWQPPLIGREGGVCRC